MLWTAIRVESSGLKEPLESVRAKDVSKLWIWFTAPLVVRWVFRDGFRVTRFGCGDLAHTEPFFGE